MADQQLQDLIDAITLFAKEMDALMKVPGNYNRGQQIARLVGDLERARDDAKQVLEAEGG
ncbi:MAG: hypothetical protein ACR2QH_01640 [Geminicoccaceae bacterium]